MLLTLHSRERAEASTLCFGSPVKTVNTRTGRFRATTLGEEGSPRRYNPRLSWEAYHFSTAYIWKPSSSNCSSTTSNFSPPASQSEAPVGPRSVNSGETLTEREPALDRPSLEGEYLMEGGFGELATGLTGRTVGINKRFCVAETLTEETCGV